MTNKVTFFWLAIVTANELALAFPPRNLPKKFRPDPSTFYLVIVVTDSRTNKQTNRQTYAGDSIILAFAGIISSQVQKYTVTTYDSFTHYKYSGISRHDSKTFSVILVGLLLIQMHNLQTKYTTVKTYTGRFICVQLNFKMQLPEEALDIYLVKFCPIAKF